MSGVRVTLEIPEGAIKLEINSFGDGEQITKNSDFQLHCVTFKLVLIFYFIGVWAGAMGQ